MNIHFSEEMMLYHHNFLHDSITENEKNLIFMQNKVNLFSLYKSPKMGNYVYYDIFQGYIFNYICQNFYFSWFHLYDLCDLMTSSLHSNEYSYWLVKKCFPNHNFHLFMIFVPFCREYFFFLFMNPVIWAWSSLLILS